MLYQCLTSTDKLTAMNFVIFTIKLFLDWSANYKKNSAKG